MSSAAELWKAVSRHTRYLITSHVRPDPDAIGSEIALALFLEKTGRECRIVNEAKLPEMYAFLPESKRVLAYPEGMDFDYEAVIVLDASDLERTGAVGKAVRDVPLFVVDHHPYGDRMADFAWVDAAGSATGQMLYEFMRYRRENMDATIATCLYAAIMTDTGRFGYANTTDRTLAVAADLVALGANPHEIARECYENVSDSQMYLLGRVASSIRRAAGGKVAYATLHAEDMAAAGASPEVAQELAELPRSLKGVVVGVLIRDIGGKAKVSLRSKGGVDVRRVAEHFGGGGHKEASGFLLESTPAEAEIVLVRYLEEYLKGA